MAFPAQAGAAQSGGQDVTGTVTVNLPTSMANGETVVMIAGLRAESWNNTPTGWTLAHESSGADTDIRIWWRKVDATWSADTTVDITHTNAGTAYWEAITMRYTGASDPDTSPPEAASAFSDSPTTGANPPSLTPTGGAKDYTWVAAHFTRDDGALTSYPTNYDDNQVNFTNTLNSRFAHCEYRLNASSQDPGAFVNTSSDWTAVTIAIHPAAVGGTNTTISVPTGPLR